jgi:hypothetical protein
VLATAPYTIPSFSGAQNVLPAEGGSAFYVKGYRSAELAAGVATQMVFVRLSGATLAVEAERVLSADAASLVLLEGPLPETGLGLPAGGTPSASPETPA